ncbi:hypothetical protein HDU99_003775, partial [Rhizoclosmatium hyalinum]
LEDVISDRISAYVMDENVRLTNFVNLQKQLFQMNQFSASTPERWNKTMRGMLALLDNHRDTSVDTFFVKYPSGEISGYSYNWTQQGLTLTTYECDKNKYIISLPSRVSTDVGAGTPQQPGYNFTLTY